MPIPRQRAWNMLYQVTVGTDAQLRGSGGLGAGKTMGTTWENMGKHEKICGRSWSICGRYVEDLGLESVNICEHVGRHVGNCGK